MGKIKDLFKDKLILGLAIGLGLVLILIIGLFAVKFFMNQSVTAINFSELTKEEITEWYEGKFGSQDGLEFIYEYSEDIEKDKVMSQSVAEGEKIDKETGLSIVLSNGPDPEVEFNLPDFVKEGYTLDEIKKYFEENKFLDVTYEFAVSDEPLNTVISLNVSGVVKRGDVILVKVSAGDDLSQIVANVPDLTSYSLNNAKAWASSNAITLEIEYVIKDGYDVGDIVSQSIAENTQISGGSTIKIEVIGVKVPDVVGLSQSSAVSSVRNAGLSTKISEEYSSVVDKGNVIRTSPAASTIVGESSQVTLVISKGPNPADVYVNVENKAGMSESSFKSYITGLGLSSPSKSGSYYDDNIAKGSVITNTSGKVNLLASISYELSVGAYQLDPSAFNNLSLNDAKNKVNSENNKRAGISFSYDTVNASEYGVSAGKVFDCTANGKKLTCKYGVEYYYIGGEYALYETPGDLDATINKINHSLSHFDLQIIKQSNSATLKGTIISITVNGKSNYTPGDYPASTKVIVYVDND